jgi:hypothetical protein
MYSSSRSINSARVQAPGLQHGSARSLQQPPISTGHLGLLSHTLCRPTDIMHAPQGPPEATTCR